MPRAILRNAPPITPATASLPGAGDSSLDELVKLIPTEVVAVFTALVAVIPKLPAAWVPWAPLVLFVLGLVLTPVVLWLDGLRTDVPAPWQQYVVWTLSFAIWGMAIQWPFGRWWPASAGIGLIGLGVVIVPFLGRQILPRPQG